MKKILAFSLILINIIVFAQPVQAGTWSPLNDCYGNADYMRTGSDQYVTSFDSKGSYITVSSTQIYGSVTITNLGPYQKPEAANIVQIFNSNNVSLEISGIVANGYLTISSSFNTLKYSLNTMSYQTLSAGDYVVKIAVQFKSVTGYCWATVKEFSVAPTPTTTTTIPPTTTTTVLLNGCIKSISGQQIYHTVTWFYSQGTGPPNNPAYQSMSLALWQSMTHEQKINSGPLYMWPAPTGGCNQLYSYPPATTTTTIPPTTTTSTTTTIPQTTTTVAPTTTTTTVPRTTTTTTTTTVAPVVQQQAPAAPAQPSKPQTPAAPVLPAKPVAPATPVQPPAVQTPTATLPKAQPPAVQAPAIPPKLQWAYVNKLVLQTIPSNMKTGAICKNGSTANTNHPLTCLKQGGVKKWIYLPSKKIYVNKKHICYLNKSTNKYTKNCKLV